MKKGKDEASKVSLFSHTSLQRLLEINLESPRNFSLPPRPFFSASLARLFHFNSHFNGLKVLFSRDSHHLIGVFGAASSLIDHPRKSEMVSSSARFATLAALLAVVGIASLAPTAVEAANATVLLYRHSTLDKVPSRAARNVAVSI